MKKLIALVMALAVFVPTLAFAGASTDAALGLGAFAVFNQMLGGVGIFHRGAVVAPAPVVVAPAPVFVHPGGRLKGFPAILERTRTALDPLTATQHLLGTMVAEVDGDAARSVCYFQAQHVRTGAAGGETYIIAGRYADTLARTADGWKITERIQAYLWRDGNRAVVAR